MRTLVLTTLFVIGCKGTPTETDPVDPDTDPPTETDVPQGCGPDAPVMESLGVLNASTPGNVQLGFDMAISDEDGGIHEVTFEGWFDTFLDDQLDTTQPAPMVAGPFELLNNQGNPFRECNVNRSVDVRLTVALEDAGIPFDTPVDIGWRVRDADDNPSNVITVQLRTPRADGTIGGGDADTDADADTDTDTDTDTDADTDAHTGLDTAVPTPTGDTGTWATGDTGTPSPADTADTAQ